MSQENDRCKNCHPSLARPGGIIKIDSNGFCPNCEKPIHADLVSRESYRKARRRWDNRMLKICNGVAEWSSCLSRKVGAVLVIDKTIIATGYNGPPRGIPHCGKDRAKKDPMLSVLSRKESFKTTGDDSMCPRQRLGHKSGQGLELCPAAHGEVNCIANAARTGVCVKGAVMYMNCGVPCKECFKLIINAGISEMVCTSMETYDNLTDFLMQNCSIKIRTYN